MCSLSASPVADAEDEPSAGQLTALVAAACAMIAGWIRTVGQVTAVVTGSAQTWLIAPITHHTNGLLPCSSFHGWKWSLIHSPSNPARSAAAACSTSSAGCTPRWTGSSRCACWASG